MDAEVDVLVVGYGGGGAAAALAARTSGAEVVAIDLADRPGGNSVLSSGSIPAAGTPSQREAGIDDSPEWMAEDILGQSDGEGPAAVVRALAASSSDLVEWIAQVTDMTMAVVATHRHVGHRVPRLHVPVGGNGRDLFVALSAANRAAGVDVLVRHEVVRLLSEGDRVVGAVVKGAGDDDETVIGARAVILATGGFAANSDLLARYCPDVVDIPYFGSDSSTGAALDLARSVGADFSAMGSYSLHATVAFPSEILLTWTAVEAGGVLLDRDGRRFTDESAGYSACGVDVLEKAGGEATVLFDEPIYDQISHSANFDDLIAMGGVKRAETIDAVAEHIGVTVDQIVSSLASVMHGHRTIHAPFYLSRVRAGLLQTQGGITIDGDARALRLDGTPVPGLYAVGGAARGLAGISGGRGYSSGSGLLAAVGLGRLAGLHSAGYARRN